MQAIRVDHLFKSYRVRAPRGNGAYRMVDKVVLDDVCFDVDDGEVLGIIGGNGAGKSTLLKVLSRITAPTRGSALVAGRVASLLEVGTGMHPEMTGRENIFLNGALLGMARPSITSRFEDIVEFAGVRDYIEVPIKHYSSGMKLRLAFAVAAHLAAEVMIVDEVLAVGDAAFQSKCLGVLQEGIRSGRTTLFVSHNMAAIENICTRVMWLSEGRIKLVGNPRHVVRQYLEGSVATHGNARYLESADADTAVSFRRVALGTSADELGAVAQGDELRIAIDLTVTRPVRGLQLLASIATIEGIPVCAFSNADYRAEWDLQPGDYRVVAVAEANRLMPRAYTISLKSFTNWGAEVFEDLSNVLTFDVLGRDVLNTGVMPLADRGVTWMPVSFTILSGGNGQG